MCTGVRQAEFETPALGEWLHGAIQACAGRTTSEDPLTFADLETRGVNLRTITTDLAYARPVDLPVREDFPIEYLFDPADLRQRVPEEIVEFLERISPAVTVKLRGGGERVLRKLPRSRMPIMLAARLSLSFPILLSTIRLWSVHPHDQQAIEHCFSDGGISSNFPIHLFDAWVPSRPTFGLDLQTRQSASETNVQLVGSGKLNQPSPVRYLPAETGYGAGHDGPWCRQATRATSGLIGTAWSWGDDVPPARGFDQGGGAEPEPTPAMRIVPNA